MPAIADYLKYANLQMAAEALYGFDANDNPAITPGSVLDTSNGPLQIQANWLTTGNLHASKFTATEAAKLSADWVVVEHISNTATGFSGTLFRNKDDGKYVLSFRSTEFVDDAARDSRATNELEIKDHGFAFGQISDMENWYQSIKSKIDGPLSVTGYSLGGHLATAFNLLHPDAASEVFTFNGAGIGKIGTADGTLASTKQQLARMITAFQSLRDSAQNTYGLESNNTGNGNTQTDPARKNQPLVYKALVALKQMSLEMDERRFALAAGMQTNAEIRLGDRTVMEYLLSPVRKAWHEAGRER